MKNNFDFLIVGAGFAGATLADRIASVLNKRVLIIDRRRHIAGNMYDDYDEHGILVHHYGPHIFHTNSKMVFDYLSRFTLWRNYQHRVLVYVNGQMVPLPINLDTVNELYGHSFTPRELQAYFDQVRDKEITISNSRDVIVSKVGEELYQWIFKNYTKKQWDRFPDELDASVISRIPVRFNRDSRYFSDRYQGIPKHGYTKLFQNMMSHPNIKIMLGVDYEEIRDCSPFERTFYSGSIDEYFQFQYGPLPYRSLRFEHETLDTPWVQPVGTVNYPNDYDYTRITEMKHLTGQDHSKTTIVYEYPKSDGEPYYPIPAADSAELYKMYEKLAKNESNVTFLGRLGSYRYYNMDQIVAQALSVFEHLK